MFNNMRPAAFRWFGGSCCMSMSAAHTLLLVCRSLHLVKAADRTLEGELHSKASIDLLSHRYWNVRVDGLLLLLLHVIGTAYHIQHQGITDSGAA
jgi:hypothetical protein